MPKSKSENQTISVGNVGELEAILDLPDDALESEQQADGSVKAVPAGTAENQPISDDAIITADELVDTPEDNINPKPIQRCPKCTADIVDGECVNCHFKP